MRSGNRGDVLSVAAILLGTVTSLAVTGVLATRAIESTAASWAAQLQPVSAAAATPSDATENAIESATEPTLSSESGDLGVAFYASSLGDEWAVSGDFGGRIRRVNDDLVVDLRDVTLRATDVDGSPPQLVGIRLGLAESTATGWRMVRQGKRVPVGRSMAMGTDLRLSSLELELDALSEDELIDRWLVVIQEISSPTSSTGVATTYAHADRAILARLLGWIGDGCD